MVFGPDVEKIIKRPKIEKPQEEFLLPTPAGDPEQPVRETPSVEEITQDDLTLAEALYNEAGNLQELIDIVIETAEPFSVQVPTSDQRLLGDTITTDDYINSIGSDSPRAHKTRQRFEWELLGGCGSNTGWSILALPDMNNLKHRLVNAALVVEGKMLVATTDRNAPSGAIKPNWTQEASESHLKGVSQSLIDSSTTYRLKFAQSLYTFNSDFRSKLITQMVSPLLSRDIRRARETLKDLLDILQKIRSVLCHAQLFLAFEYFSVRDALLSLIKQEIIETGLSMVIVLLSKIMEQLTKPIINFFDDVERGGNLFEQVAGDAASEAILGVIGSTVSSLIRQYNDFAADVIRAVEQESDTRLQKLQALGERNVVGKWIQHLDKAILQIQRALETQVVSREIATQLVDQILVPPTAKKPKVAERVQTTFPYSELGNIPFFMRTMPFTPDSDAPKPPTHRDNLATQTEFDTAPQGTASFQSNALERPPINRRVDERDPNSMESV